MANPAVLGLAAGDDFARRRRRRKRLRARVSSLATVVILTGAVGAAGYVVYRVWLTEEGWNTDDSEQRYTDEELENLIVEIQEQPRWNGPGNPTFGVGDGQP